jgi:flagellar hook-associated protein 2
VRQQRAQGREQQAVVAAGVARMALRVAGLASSNNHGLASAVGIQVAKDGTFTFDRAKFLTAVADDPDAVARLFGRGGTGTGGVTFAAAAEGTAHGTYDVVITTPATQATSATLFSGGVSTTGRIAVKVGSTTATLDVTAGQTVGQVISGLNATFAQSGLALSAEVDGAGLRVRATSWGSAGDFEINDDVTGVGVWAQASGTDVAGTIDGVAASGSGRRLLVPAVGVAKVAGLSVDVPGGVTGAIGSVTYEPGLAARVVEVSSFLTRVDSGTLTTAKVAADRRIKDLADQMTRLEDRLTIREANLRQQYASLQTLIANMQNQGTAIAGAIAGLPALG